MLHPHTTLAWVDDTIGVGVVATRPIPRGTITWVRDPLDLTLTPEQVARLGPMYAEQLDRYGYMEADGLVLCWDHGRFVNHHCEANCLAMDGAQFEVAVRDIEVGEQLTDEYGCLGITEPMPCRCGSPICRGVVRPDDGKRLYTWLRARFDAGMEQVGAVAQPLADLLQVPVDELVQGGGRPLRVRANGGERPRLSLR